MNIKPDRPLQAGDWQYLPEQDKLVQFDAAGKIAVTADLDNLSQKVANYFIVNAGKLITKDELLQDVWGIRDVSDGRVTRVIRVLRVALGDDTREPTYIETIPKRGYRFIAPVAEIAQAEPVEQSEPADQVAAKATRQRYWPTAAALAAVFTLFIGALTWWLWPKAVDDTEKSIPLLRYKPVTALDGLEFYHNMSDDERYLVYSYASPDNENVTVLMLEDLQQHKRIQLTEDSYSSFGAAFSPDGRYIAYQRLLKDTICEIRLVEMDLVSFTPISDSVLTECGRAAVSSRLSWSPNGAFLVYPDMPGGEKQMSIHLLSLASKSVERITIPPVSSFGDYSARFSRKGDRIAFLRESAGSAQIWLMDLSTRETNLLTKIADSFPGNIDWGLDDSYIIYPSSPVSLSTVKTNGDVEIIAYTDESSNEIQLMKSGSVVATVGSFSSINLRKLANRINNTELLNEKVFSSNRNETYVETSPVNSGPLAVLSRRTGLPQVWLMFADGTQRQLTHFSEVERIRSLMFSPDGTKLLIQMNQKILVYSMNSFLNEIKGNTGAVIGTASWRSDSEGIYFPEVNNGKWQIIEASIANVNERRTVSVEKELYLPSHDGDYVFWRDSNTKKFYIQRKGLAPEALHFTLPETQIAFKYQVTAEGIYFSKLISELDYGLFYYNLAKQSVEPVVDKMRLSRFSVTADQKYVYLLDYELGDLDVAILPNVIESL